MHFMVVISSVPRMSMLSFRSLFGFCSVGGRSYAAVAENTHSHVQTVERTLLIFSASTPE
jgi:hypothetical protein